MNIHDYYTSIIRFVNSFTIKIDEIRKQLDFQLYVQYGKKPPPLENNKYVLNLQGKLHPTDYKVYTNSIVKYNSELTVDLLDKNHNLKNDLLKFGNTFNRLCINNPGMSTYIRGCLNPITYPEYVNLPNYSLIYYNKDFLLENEIEIIPLIEQFIKDFMYRYHNKKYMIDELYLPSMLDTLYNGLVLYIITLKLKNTLTNKADLFHIYHKLSSHKYLYNYMDSFDLSTKIWLYGNINNIKTNVGMNKTLNKILNNVLNKNTIGVGKIVLNKEKPSLNKDIINKHDLEYYSNNFSYTVVPANNSLFNIEDKSYEIPYLNNIYRDNMLIPKTSNITSESNIVKSKNNNMYRENTKTFILDEPNKINVSYLNNFTQAVSNILYLIRNKKIDFIIDYYNELDYHIYKLYPIEIEYLIVYGIYKFYGLPKEQINFILEGIFDKSKINKENILSKTWYKDMNNSSIEYLLSDKNLNLATNNIDNLKTYLKSINDISKKAWYLISNSTDNTLKNDIKQIVTNIHHVEKFTYDINYIVDYVENGKLSNFFTNDQLYLKNIFKLIETISNITMFPIENLEKRFKRIIQFFNKTTSYTINLIMDLNFGDIYESNHSINSINLGYKSYLEVKDADWDLMDEANYIIRSYGFKDSELDVSIFTKNKIKISPFGKIPCISKYDIDKSPDALVYKKFRLQNMKSELYNSGIYDDYNLSYGMVERPILTSRQLQYIKTYSYDNGKMINNINTYTLPTKPVTKNYQTRDNDFGYIHDDNRVFYNHNTINTNIKGSMQNIISNNKDSIDINNTNIIKKHYDIPYKTTGGKSHILSGDSITSVDETIFTTIDKINYISTETVASDDIQLVNLVNRKKAFLKNYTTRNGGGVNHRDDLNTTTVTNNIIKQKGVKHNYINNNQDDVLLNNTDTTKKAYLKNYKTDNAKSVGHNNDDIDNKDNENIVRTTNKPYITTQDTDDGDIKQSTVTSGKQSSVKNYSTRQGGNGIHHDDLQGQNNESNHQKVKPQTDNNTNTQQDDIDNPNTNTLREGYNKNASTDNTKSTVHNDDDIDNQPTVTKTGSKQYKNDQVRTNDVNNDEDTDNVVYVIRKKS